VRGLVLAVLLASLSTAAASVSVLPNSAGQFAPRDTCRSDPTIARFLARVEQAQQSRDPAQLKALATDEVTASFGGEVGPDSLGEEIAANPKIWDELGKVLKLGCQREGTSIRLPWFFSLDFGNADMTVIKLAAGPDVPLYLSGDRKSPVLRRLNWQLVTTTDSVSRDSNLQRVRVVGTRESGWVQVARLRSQIDYRLVAVREDDEWKISAFVAGD
jgi:hypothetical protein